MVFMLIMQLLQIGIDNIPPVTLASIGLCIAVHLQFLPSFHNVCFSAALLFAPSVVSVTGSILPTIKGAVRSHFSHVTDFHLYYNMMSWVYKARAEERRMGSELFFLWTVCALLGTTLSYIGITSLLILFTDPDTFGPFAHWFDPTSCVMGFSGIIFALKTVQQLRRRGPDEMDADANNFLHPFLGLLPDFMRHAVWLEIIWIQLLAPDVSFLGHVAGIVCGMGMHHFGAEAMLRGPAMILTDIRRSFTDTVQQAQARRAPQGQR